MSNNLKIILTTRNVPKYNVFRINLSGRIGEYLQDISDKVINYLINEEK